MNVTLMYTKPFTPSSLISPLPLPPLPSALTYCPIVGSRSSRIPPVRDTDTHSPCWNGTECPSHPENESMARKEVIKRKSVKNKEKQMLTILNFLENLRLAK